MTDNFKEIGSLFGREGAGAGFAKQTDKESFTYAFAWPADSAPIGATRITTPSVISRRQPVTNTGFLS